MQSYRPRIGVRGRRWEIWNEQVPHIQNYGHSDAGGDAAAHRATDGAAAAAAVLRMIPLLLGPLMWELSDYDETLFFTLDVFIWALFAADLLVKLAVAPNRLRLRTTALAGGAHRANPVLPAPANRAAVRVRRAGVWRREAAGERGLPARLRDRHGYRRGYVRDLVERGHDSINSFPDALWWSFVTVTTVGYGDLSPVTPMGRAIAVVLMLVGIGLFGGLTANLASAIMKSEENVEGEGRDSTGGGTRAADAGRRAGDDNGGGRPAHRVAGGLRSPGVFIARNR